MQKRKILVIAAHPDDEILGCGATVAKLVAGGAEAFSLIVAQGFASRTENSRADHEGGIKVLQNSARAAAKIIGTQAVEFCDFPDNQMDTVSLLSITQRIESVIDRFAPDIIFTHDSNDLNIDHQICFRAVMTATRPQPGAKQVAVYSFEIPSSTEWTHTGIAFTPNVFIDVAASLEKKLAALKEYEHEMRAWPHPRSLVGVEALAKWRGASMGATAAEAFKLVRAFAL